MVSFFRKVIRNWKLKILAFALAVLLWVVVTSEQVTTEWLPVPLRVEVTDPNYRLGEVDLPTRVEVRFSGSGRDLVSLALRPRPLVLSVPRVENNVASVGLDPRMAQVPPQMAVSALDVRPTSVRLQFIRVESITVPVRPRISNGLGAEWTILDPFTVDPPRVRITGPVKLLTEVHELSTEPIELAPGDSVVDREVALDTTAIRDLELSTRTIRVTGRVERVVERVIPAVPISTGPGFVVFPGAVDVTLRGAESRLGSIVPGTFRVVVSIPEVPAQIPVEGMVVPLGVDGLPPRVEARTGPVQARLLPAGPADTVPAANDGGSSLPRPLQEPGPR